MEQARRRVLALQGASNFRDLGGYRGHGGRAVRWRRMYRSDHLSRLSAADIQEIRRRRVAAALDFRGVQESAAATYDVEGVQRVALSIEPTVAQRMQELIAAGRYLDEAVTVSLMEDLYRSIIRSQTGRLKAFFGHLLAADEPVVFHCTAGKDRTGIAAALLLSALGVSRADIMADFLLSNEVFRPPQVTHDHLSEGARLALWSVRPQFLDAAWSVIDVEHGGTEAYLRDALALDSARLEELARRYLDAA